MKKLKDILQNIEILEIFGSKEKEISTIVFDSREIIPGSVFVAIKGALFDGNDFIGSSVEKKASVIVSEIDNPGLPQGVTFVKVANARQALAMVAANFHGHPSKKLKLIGVTGTNGKTTVATLLYETFMKLGYKTGLLSTIKNVIHGKETGTTHTTPDPVKINKLLDQMVQEGCGYCFMEVSSHAIDQDRTEGLAFSGGIFTNISHDHLDYHETFANYIKVKKKFFDHLSEQAFSLVNKDDRNSMVMIQNTKAGKYTFGLKTFAGYKAKIIESHFDGMLLQIDNKELWTRFAGHFNAYNLLAVYAAALLLKQEKEEVLTVISSLTPVRGRFEHIRSKSGTMAIVDYAHTPDALLNVLKSIKQLRKGNETVITVVGAGGNRDKPKRPVMARIAVENSDKLILTSDNPRDEEPESILDDMQEGIPVEQARKMIRITDRKEAIKTACMMAREEDIILVAGKGHETYQEIKGKKYHFDDKEIIQEQFLIKN